ncbi:UNKNOWN [Stylonychia lemnae]|uniref:RanBP2-type domain-containing protein n=1 Tax=Stylonychia lemnae TaxID=5949 RepID=A0A078AMQ6_STYLE|nr:UNKNOWN [Stylonychia lemnae]|eukprot:CDW82662.1 UNKNOWN [Stylonychia lemnae]
MKGQPAHKEEVKQPKLAMVGVGKKIGTSNVKVQGDWRCATCKFSNTSDKESCGMCREAKKVLKEPKVIGGSNPPRIPGHRTQNKNNNQYEEQKVQKPQLQPFSGNNVQTLNGPQKSQQNRGGSMQPGQARIMTLNQLNQDTMAGDLGKPKQQRFHKESTIEMLQKIAKNSDNLDQMPCVKGAQDLKKLKDRQFVQNTREPAKFNMETFVREYGDVPK